MDTAAGAFLPRRIEAPKAPWVRLHKSSKPKHNLRLLSNIIARTGDKSAGPQIFVRPRGALPMVRWIMAEKALGLA